jgi:predicted AlkP superfamily pyrophosphatase or phosphodiesterase
MKFGKLCSGLVVAASFLNPCAAQAPKAAVAQKPAGKARAAESPARVPGPKLVVLLVVDQMRGDYVDKFQGQWTGGLQRLVSEGAWFREAAYPYAATETCVGHSTISTGSLPATHGMVANAWWDRDTQKMVTCTLDPKATNIAYGGATTPNGDSAWRMRVPAFAEELRFQSGGATRVVTFSLKARAAITMAGHKADAVTWFENGSWTTSSTYGTMPFVETFAKAHPVESDLGKTWDLTLSRSSYFYDEKAAGAVAPGGWDLTFPHVLRSGSSNHAADGAFFSQWATSPYADTYLTKMAEDAVDQLGLGKSGGTDFLGISYSSVDYVGHAFGPRSWEIQDVLIRLDKDLDELFKHLDAKVGRGNYVVALSADHGAVPAPEDMQKTGADAGVLHMPEISEKIDNALEPFHYTKPVIARLASTEVYFSPGIYERLQSDPTALRAVLGGIRSVPGVAEVYRAEEVEDRPATQSPIRRAEAASYFRGRSGDLLVVPKPYYLVAWSAPGKPRDFGTGHGTPYYYDQHVPLLLMGWGIEHGQYFGRVTPADIAPTLAALCGVTLSSRDGHALSEAIRASRKPGAAPPAGP